MAFNLKEMAKNQIIKLQLKELKQNLKKMKSFDDLDFSVEKITKKELIKLKQIYGEQFLTWIIFQNPKHVLSLLSESEICDMILRIENPNLNIVLIKYMMKDSTYQDLLFQIFESLNHNFQLHNYLEQIISLQQQDKRYTKFLTNKLFFNYLRYTPHNEKADLSYYLNNNETMEYIFKNIIDIPPLDLPEWMKRLTLSIFFTDLFSKYKREIYWRFFCFNQKENDENRMDFEALLLSLDDILKREKINFWNLEYLKQGAFSGVFKCNEVVLKIGRMHNNYETVNTSYLLQPITRKQVESLSIYFEISPLCNTANISLEDAYQVYKGIREEGKMWLDVKLENIGRLPKDYQYPFSIESETVGLKGSVNKTKGELVIIDADYIIYENDFNKDIGIPRTSFFDEFEKRYQEEKNRHR